MTINSVKSSINNYTSLPIIDLSLSIHQNAIIVYICRIDKRNLHLLSMQLTSSSTHVPYRTRRYGIQNLIIISVILYEPRAHARNQLLIRDLANYCQYWNLRISMYGDTALSLLKISQGGGDDINWWVLLMVSGVPQGCTNKCRVMESCICPGYPLYMQLSFIQCHVNQ